MTAQQEAAPGRWVAPPAGRRVALVTGASRNIGRAIALRLAGQGCDVVVHTRRDEAAAAQVVAAVRECGVRGSLVLADLADTAAVQRMAQSLDRVDILVNNAAIRPERPFLEIGVDEWRRVFAVTVEAPFLLCQALLPGMVDRRWGRVINLTGVRAQMGARGRASSAAAKHALIGLTRSLANEFGRHGVTVNAVSPGTIVTDEDRRDDARLRARKGIGAVDRFGEPEDVAEAVAFLASDAAAFVTGQTVGVNGGELMA